MRKIIVIEGVDSSGKETQAKLLAEALGAKELSFPNYNSNSSYFIKQYLSGAYGDKPEDVSPKTASIMFAMDRFESYRTDWKNDYEEDKGYIVADRYTTSNMNHQAAKCKNDEKDEFIDWLKDLEYNILGIPKPDLVIFLDMPPEYGMKLSSERKLKNGMSKDIHENNMEYLKESYNNSLNVAIKENWHIVHCVDSEGNIKSIETIHEEIMRTVESL